MVDLFVLRVGRFPKRRAHHFWRVARSKGLAGILPI
jgi:hypothetical protein